jgi:hypothetical protein
VWSRAAGVAAGAVDRGGVAMVEESAAGGVLVAVGGRTEGRSTTIGRAAGGAPKAALCSTGRAPNQTSSMASVVAPPHRVTYVIARRIHTMVPLKYGSWRMC